MDWTTEKPTEPGYYWAMLPTNKWGEVVRVFNDWSGKYLLVRSSNGTEPLHRYGEILWAGPIPMPEVKK